MEESDRHEPGLVFENVTSDGRLSDTFDGRPLNPGHAIEGIWFLMDIDRRLHNQGVHDCQGS